MAPSRIGFPHPQISFWKSNFLPPLKLKSVYVGQLTHKMQIQAVIGPNRKFCLVYSNSCQKDEPQKVQGNVENLECIPHLYRLKGP